MFAALLLTVFRMVVLPVQFPDRQFTHSRQALEADVARAEAYFNRQFGGGMTFRFDLAPAAVTLSRPYAWYGADAADRKDVRFGEAVREALDLQQGQLNLSLYDNDSDGSVDNICLITAGAGENDGGGEDAFWPQMGLLSSQGGAVTIQGKRIDRFTSCPEGRPGIFCHEFGHVLGLPALYDTDGPLSGGESEGLLGTSLMDEGCLKSVLPDFGAPEFEILQLGRCDTLSVGRVTLQPLLQGRRYLKANGTQEGECFLFSARDGGLYVWHLDRSDNPAGHSDRLNADLTARERWDYGCVNDDPSHPCLRLLPADPTAPGVSGVPFPQAGHSVFGSDTPSAFRFWNGYPSAYALTDIRPADDGGVSFEVFRPLVLTDQAVFQDAAIVRWTTSDRLEDVRGYELSWTDGEEEFQMSLGPRTQSCTLEKLLPRTRYHFSLSVLTDSGERFSAAGDFDTKIYREGSFPYIYLNSTLRNLDGSFPSGSKLPLRVFNATDVQDIRWTLNGISINPGPDGEFTLMYPGILKAVILHTDGTSETIVKEVSIK
ncbi:MAG: immune inhibitor A [Bacteroidales bacterium]|nr:immune inhibitor A [Bacteroidales bacterium]